MRYILTPPQKLFKIQLEENKDQNPLTNSRIVEETITSNSNHFVTEFVR